MASRATKVVEPINSGKSDDIRKFEAMMMHREERNEQTLFFVVQGKSGVARDEAYR